MRQLANAPDVDEGSDRVRGPREGDDPGPATELRSQIVEVERRVVAQLREPDAQPEVVGELEPGSDVAVMVELRHDDLVPGRELPRRRAREREVEGRHVGAENDLLRAATEESAGHPPRLGHEEIAPTTSSGAWVPPGASKNTSSRPSAEKRRRTAGTSIMTVDTPTLCWQRIGFERGRAME